MTAMKIKRWAIETHHLRQNDEWLEGWVRSRFGEVTVNYCIKGDGWATFQMYFVDHCYCASMPGKFSEDELVSAARDFAEQAHAMHEKGGAR